MSSNSKEIAKLKKKYSKWPWETGFSGFKNWLLQNMPVFLVLWLLRKFLVKSDYKLKRESIKFFQLSNQAYGSNLPRKCDRLLLIALKLVLNDFETEYLKLIRKSVRITMSDTRRRVEVSDIVLQSTKELGMSKFDATCWYQLSRGLFSLGYFRAAWVARENSLDQSVLEGSSTDASYTDMRRAIQACLERRDVKGSKTLLNINHRALSEKHLNEIREYLNFQQNFIDQQDGESPAQHGANQDLIKRLIVGKSVALVGPGVPQGHYLEEIDERDTVIRMKFTDDAMLDPLKSHGLRTDISFIGAIDAFAIQRPFSPHAESDLKLILSSNTSRQFVGNTPVYVIEGEGELYRTPTTSGIRTLLEVIKNYPKNLMVYGFDFYATLTPYSAEMTAFYERSSWKFGHPNDFIEDGVYLKFARARDFSNHDPVSNFCFAQNLYKAGLFDIEPYGKSILELTPYQYVERLEEMLGDW